MRTLPVHSITAVVSAGKTLRDNFCTGNAVFDAFARFADSGEQCENACL
jgi:hypothetical protein